MYLVIPIVLPSTLSTLICLCTLQYIFSPLKHFTIYIYKLHQHHQQQQQQQ